MTEKSALRREITAAVEQLDPAYIASSDEGIARHVLALPEYIAARTVLLYVAVGREIATDAIIRDALARGKTVCVPESLPQGIMVSRQITSLGELTHGRFGIPAPPDDAPEITPDALDFVLVPAMTYDRAGYRLGRGGGYYDRYLPRTHAFTAGVARERLLLDSVPREPHDAAVRRVVTEQLTMNN
ncbi:MAG: 5-formyltetrahydrofolate cyclo-ligase [Oscillospiraceae bacterium]|jgi:5-formyltetrahydrofolate cyclo-ligase|nr:5-formyltetrahydrofolate cyclo-ligase [Oscillospiraceae bacterium]